MLETADENQCISLLIVENEDIVARSLEKILISMGYCISGIVKSGEDALTLLESHSPDLIIMDIHLDGEMDGIQTSFEVNRQYRVPVVYLTADIEDETLKRVKKTSMFGYIIKPFTKESLRLGIEIAINRHKIEQKLEEQNQDLDAFTYSVSHDLKAPVRNISRYADLLLNDFSEISDAEKKAYIQRIIVSSNLMDEMIQGFLVLSRAGSTSLAYDKVCLSDISKQILDNLSESSPRRSVEIRIQPEVYATGDRNMLSIAMENLLNNAWKYTGKESHPKIEFGTLNDNITYYVKDNGVGFDMEKSGDVFKPFKRVTNDSSIPGIGIGLATVKRIISRYGGRIWFESKPGEGSVFYFQL